MADEEREEKKAVRYAEETLGVHSVHGEAMDALGLLEEALDRVAAYSQSMRLYDSQIETREVELIGELRAKHTDASGAAIERMMKESRVHDEAMADLRKHHRDAHDAYIWAEADVSRYKYRLRVLTSRLNELGGLLTFYAATK